MRRRPVPAGFALALLVAVASGLGGCAPGLRDAVGPVAPVQADPGRRDCLPGTFLGTMTINCPQAAE